MAELKLWKSASNYLGDEYPDYYVVLGRSRDSGLLDQSNFDVALEQLGGEKAEEVKVIRFGHWAAGWGENILVHKDAAGAVGKAKSILDQLESYPVLDEEDYSQRETDAAIRNIRDAGRSKSVTAAEAAKIYRWLWDNDYPIENTDDTGYYPDDKDLEKALTAIRRKKKVAVVGRRGTKSKKTAGVQVSVRGMR